MFNNSTTEASTEKHSLDYTNKKYLGEIKDFC